MVNVLLYAIVNDNHVIEQWASHAKRVRLTGFVERFMAKLGNVKAITVCSVKMDGLWVYYFCQETFLFVLVADGLERSANMQHYLRIITQIFYQNYDETRFPTVLDRIITQINRIENCPVDREEQEELVKGYNLVRSKQRFNSVLVTQDHRSKRAYVISIILFLSIVLLAGVYFYRRN